MRETGLIGEVIGPIRQGLAGAGLEADQPDRDRVSSDQGFLIGRSGRDRSDQGQLRSGPAGTNGLLILASEHLPYLLHHYHG